ncbi:MAG: hypothetical protein V1918_06725, partial [Planctomycetota bacterium]
PGDARAPLANLVMHPGRTVLFSDGGYVSDATRDGPPGSWREDGTKPWKPYTAFSLTGPLPPGQLGTPPDFGYDWGNTYPGSGVGAMGWDGRYRPLPRHPKTTVGMVDGHAELLSIEELVLPGWGEEACLFDNYVK